MPKTVQSKPEISEAGEPVSEVFSAPTLERLLAENARLKGECLALKGLVIKHRQQANYYKRQHQRAVERENEKALQIEVLKSKVSELTHRIFGGKSERSKEGSSGSVVEQPKRGRGQQPGAPGHGRKVREVLPVVEVEVLPPPEQIFCAHCNKPWEPMGEPEVSEKIEWEVRIVRTRTKRPKMFSAIGQLYSLNQSRLALAVVENPGRKLPAPFVEIDAERIGSSDYQHADQCLRDAVSAMASTRDAQLKQEGLRRARRKILDHERPPPGPAP